MMLKETENFYKTSDEYRDLLKSIGNDVHYEPYLKYALLCKDEGLRFLDLGCGTGYTTDMLSRNGFDSFGIDVSFNFINSTKKQASKNLHFSVGNVCNLPYKDSSFDVVGTFDVLEHLGEVEKFFSEAARVLKPGGKIIVISPCVITPFTPLKALFVKGGRHSVYNTRKEAFAAIFKNICIILKKKFSKKLSMCLRDPKINKEWQKREDDVIYMAHPIDIKRIFDLFGIKLQHYQKDGPGLLHKAVGWLMPNFASTIYIVGVKTIIIKKEVKCAIF